MAAFGQSSDYYRVLYYGNSAPVNKATVVAPHPFNPDADAAALRKAMKGIGTDEAEIVKVLGARPVWHRKEIEKVYKQTLGRDLLEDIKSEVSGNFQVALELLLQWPAQVDARALRRAIEGAGTNEGVLIEILATRTNAGIQQITQEYNTIFKRDLAKDIAGDTSGDFKRLLIALQCGHRDETRNVDAALVASDVERLHKAGPGKLGTDEEVINGILGRRSFEHLHAVTQQYKAAHGKSLREMLVNETSGSLEDTLVAIIESAENMPAFFARRLHKAMAGAGTSDLDLILTVVSRCDIDMVDIKTEYQTLYKKSLASDIKGDTSGDYKKLLLALIGEH